MQQDAWPKGSKMREDWPKVWSWGKKMYQIHLVKVKRRIFVIRKWKFKNRGGTQKVAKKLKKPTILPNSETEKKNAKEPQKKPVRFPSASAIQGVWHYLWLLQQRMRTLSFLPLSYCLQRSVCFQSLLRRKISFLVWKSGSSRAVSLPSHRTRGRQEDPNPLRWRFLSPRGEFEGMERRSSKLAIRAVCGV